ncbi:MAG: alpha/beta hydrolase [Pseudomonadota bacterium]
MSGSGPALLLLHGWPFHSASFRHLLPDLSQRFRCVALDALGLDGHPVPKGAGMGFDDHATRALDTMDRLGVDRFSILAHNTGATIARLMAARQPARIERLFLLNTEIPFHRPPFIPFYQAICGAPGFTTVQRALMSTRAFRHSRLGFGGCFHNPDHIDGEFQKLFCDYWLDDPVRARGLIAYLRGLNFSDVDRLDEVHANIRAPITWIWGEDDPTFPVSLGADMAERAPATEAFHRIAKTRFLPHEERPERVAALVR